MNYVFINLPGLASNFCKLTYFKTYSRSLDQLAYLEGQSHFLGKKSNKYLKD